MKKLLLIPLVLFFACTSIVPDTALPAKVPETRIRLLTGEHTTFDRYLSKPTVLFFWGSWCGKSRRFIKKLNAFAKTRPDYNFIAVALDSEKKYEKYLAYIRENELNSLIHAFSGNEGEDEAFVAYRGKDVPVAYVIRDNRIVAISDNFNDLQKAF